MKLLLERKFKEEEYTIGNLSIDGRFFSNTIEDKVIDVNKNGKFDNGETKVYGKSAIPYGTYQVILSYSPKFKRILPEILDVPHFTGIRIHRGNTAEDSAGCLIVGENSKKGMVLNSTSYEIRLVQALTEAENRGEKNTITIV